jgi:hypothetical protein
MSVVNEHLMRPGTWSLDLIPDVPMKVTDQIRNWVDENAGSVATGAHLIVTPVRVDSGLGDAAVLDAAIYSGPITARPTRTSLEGVGLESWLDSYLDADLNRTAGTVSQWLGDILINDLSTGTATATGTTNVTQLLRAYSMTHRQALDHVAEEGGWEWKVKPDFTVDAAVSGTLFRQVGDDGAIVLTAHEQGPDGRYRGVEGGIVDQALTKLGPGLLTKAIAVGEGEGPAIAVGSATKTRNLNAPKGATPDLVGVFSAPSEPDSHVDGTATNWLSLQGMRRKIKVSSTTVCVRRFLEPGDEVYVYDLPSGLVATTGLIPFRGESISPITVRVLSLSWPIEENWGVYIRSNETTPTILDISDYYEYINHNFGSAPTSAVATSRGSAVNHLYIRAISATQLQVRCYLNGTLVTSTSVAVGWFAFG